MKKVMLLLLGIVVYLNNGKVFNYPSAQSSCDNSERSGIISSGHPASVIYISTDQPGYCEADRDIVATFPIMNVERVEIKK